MGRVYKGEPTRRPAIEALLLEGKQPAEVAKVMHVHRGYVHRVQSDLRTEGRLAGRNVG